MEESTPRFTIINNPTHHRFEAVIDEQVAARQPAMIQYNRGDGYIVLAHTEVPKALEGQGIGSQLVKFALTFAEEHNLQVMPLCSFVAAYIRRHPEYRKLLRPGFEV